MGRKAKKASRIEAHIHEDVNDVRNKHGQRILENDHILADVARRHSKDMARNDFVEHQGSDGSTPHSRAPFGYRCISENISKQSGRRRDSSKIADDAILGWSKSQGHRENMLRSASRYSGVGVWISDSSYYITHMFSGRKSLTRFIFESFTRLRD